MKKILFLIQLIAAVMLYSTTVQASGGHGKGHHKHHHKHHHSHPEEVRYYQPQPQVYQPRPQYPQPRDQRSTQGLAGGVVGSVVGYELGNGNPLATGVGAAAGSYLGNEIAGRR